MKRYHSVPYVVYSVSLHGCVDDPRSFATELRAWLMNRLDPDFESDLEVELEERAGINACGNVPDIKEEKENK